MTWTASEPANAVIAAFVTALTTMEDIVADAKVEAGPVRYKYATLANVLAETRPKLAAHGLVLSQHAHDNGVTTVIFHESGQWLSFPPLKVAPVGGTPQHLGSAVSYARRYSVLSVCGLATEDDDGRAASVAPTPPEPHDPLAERVDRLFVQMKALTPEDKAVLKDWADGRSLAPKFLYDEPDWLSEVEAFLDEGLGGGDPDDGYS